MIGSLIDQKYQVVRLLGQGGMGAVYEAEHTGTGRRVALKLIANDVPDNREILSRFQREARAVGAIDTQHIVQVFDTGRDAASGAPFIAMELLSGEDLDQLIGRLGAIPLPFALRVTVQAGLGLQKAHEAGVVHRDVKPANLFLARRDGGELVIKILDFGVAKVRAASTKGARDETLTGLGGILGSPAYMSPEQAKASANIDHRSDLWSLGVVLYETLAGRTPHQREGVGALLTAIHTEEPFPLLQAAPGTPPEVAAVVMRALRRDPAERFQTATEMVDALLALLPEGCALHERMLQPSQANKNGGPMVLRPRPEAKPATPSELHHRQVAETRVPAAAELEHAHDHSSASGGAGASGSSSAEPYSSLGDSQFGKYRLIAALGQGGMADVYLAVATGQVSLGFNKLVVVKRVRASLADDPESLGMLLDEARLAARLNHPNLIQTNEVGQVGKQYFIAMEFLDGQPLHRIINRAKERLPRALLYRVLVDVLAGLHCAHELTDYDGTPLQVVHRDVSPHNVFVTYDGHVKVVDFGIAKALGRTTETRTGVAKGKISYMAPEQAMAQPVDRRADLFSVGVMLWEGATRQRIWKGLQDVQVLQRLLAGDIPASPREVAEDVPEEIDRICARALSARTEDRFATAAEFQLALESYLLESGIEPSTEARTLKNRELGKLVAELFAEERRELKAIIERQLGELQRRPSGGIKIASVFPPDGQSTPASAAHSATVGKSPPPNPRRTRNLLPAAALVAATLIGVSVVRATGGWGEAPPVASAGTAAITANPPEVPLPSVSTVAAPAPPAMIRLTVGVSPPEATLTIDDGPTLGNPHAGSVPVDSNEHVVRAQAPGYLPKTATIRFDRDADLKLTLERLPAGSSAPGPGPRDPAKPRPKRPIDEASPWQ